MWLDNLSMIAVGILAACIVFVIRRTLGARSGRLPRWLMPAAIGASMIAYSIWNEYSWFDRVAADLPPTVAIVSEGERSAPWAPWTYIWPVKIRFAAMDTRVRVASDARPGLIVTELLLVERWRPTRRVPMAFDCHYDRRADLLEGARVEADGRLQGTQWVTMEPDSPLLLTACHVGIES